MPQAFKDHFSTQATSYSRFRPGYPGLLYERLAGLAPGRALAIDVGCGNGQAATGLADYFESVLATDPSAAQLASASPHPRVTYRCEAAESISAEDGSADLLTAAVAAHWFDWPRFVAEAGRVLRPGGVLAVWTYGLFRAGPGVDGLVDEFYRVVVGPWWPRERCQVDEGYRHLAMPFTALSLAAPALEMAWTADDALGYIGTWSAVQQRRKRMGDDPLALVEAPLRAAWGLGPRMVRAPIALRASRR